MEICGQLEQDKFVLKVLKEKINGYFCEIGSRDAIDINNSYTLEKNYNWKGIMVEFDTSHIEQYKKIRPNSIHLMQDARQINYRKVFDDNNFPVNCDYLQIDLEVENRSTLDVLEIFDKDVFDKYKFATITFEHDIYNNNDIFDTRQKSRDIFNKRGYIRVFSDVFLFENNEDLALPFEDWYVHPDLVDINYVNELINKNNKNYTNKTINNVEKAIKWNNIEY